MRGIHRRRWSFFLVLALLLTGTSFDWIKAESVNEIDLLSWEQEDVVVTLDEEFKDENGCTYIVNNTKTAVLKSIAVGDSAISRTVSLRVPDVVIYNDIRFEVTEINISCSGFSQDQVRLELFIGKNVDSIELGNCYMPVTAHIHKDNDVYMEAEGSIFTKDGSQLIRFSDTSYTKDSVYELPKTVQTLEKTAFYAADIKELVLNDTIQSIPGECFRAANIRKIDCKNVTEIGGYAFFQCYYLDEIKMNHVEKIGQYAFSKATNLKYVYIPPDANVEMYAFAYCYDLRAVVCGEGVQIEKESVFFECNSLQTLILPMDMTNIPDSFLAYAYSLRKCYIPDSVLEIAPNSLRSMRATLYGKEGNAASNYLSLSKEIIFQSTNQHEHDMKEVTFFAYDTWYVGGKYCEECGYASLCEAVEYTDEKEIPPILEQLEESCPEFRDLSDKNMDEQNIVYQLNEEDGTASVSDIKPIEEQYGLITGNRYYTVPSKVRKEGQEYAVTTIASRAFSGAAGVTLPDSVTTLEEESFYYCTLHHLVLGAGVSRIADNSFACATIRSIRVSGENRYYVCEDGVLYDQSKTRLIKYTEKRTEREYEYTVPRSVIKIVQNAFYRLDKATRLRQINIYDADTIDIHASAFPNEEQVRIQYLDSYGSISTIPPEEPTIEPTQVPTEEPPDLPTIEPTQVPTEAPPEEPAIEPTQVPTEAPPEEPTIEPTQVPTEAPPDLPTIEPTQVPTEEPPDLPTIEPTQVPAEAPPDLPTIEPTQVPTEAPPDEPTIEPTQVPTEAPPEESTIEPTQVPTEAPTDLPVASEQKQSVYEGIKGFCVKTKKSGKAVLTWKRASGASLYKIFRSSKKNGKYKLLRTISGSKVRYTDEVPVTWGTYYYYIIPLYDVGAGTIQGKKSSIASFQGSGIRPPTIAVKKGQIGSTKYFTVKLKKYQGKYVQIYISTNGEGFHKLKLVTEKIEKYKGKLKIRYMLRNTTIRLKVRTYRKEGEKNIYGNFSQVKVIRV